ncbi:MAG TPA: hypothetical protein VIS76_09905 [Pseudomonadales bacterium]
MTESEGLILSGSVGDGPIVGADILVEDARGRVLLTTESDAYAAYEVRIAGGTPLPVTIRVSGGTDLVTGRAADFELLGATFGSGPVTLNASPYTTLAVRTAWCMGALTPENLTLAWSRIHHTMNLGWDRARIGNPMSEPVTEGNIGTVLIANEALGEVVRRTAQALAPTGDPLNADQVMAHLGCELAGALPEGDAAASRASATILAAAAAVRIEVIAGALRVDGQDAMPRLDDSLRTVLPGSAQSVTNATLPLALIEQTQNALGVLQTLGRNELADMAAALGGARPATARGQLQAVLSAAHLNALLDLPADVAAADGDRIAELTERASSPAPLPLISFAADPTQVPHGTSTRLSWAATDAERCSAQGGWSGEQPSSGSVLTAALNTATEFVLTCSGRGGATTQQVFVDVITAAEADPEPQPAATPDPTPPPEPTPQPSPTPPTVNLSLASSTISAGASTSLTWSASNAGACTASGGWSGTRATSGSQSVSPVTTTTYTLTCSGNGGSSSASVTLNISAEPPELSFVASALTVNAGDSVVLTWSSTGTTSCTAGGAWSGNRPTNGTAQVGPVSAASTFSLTCSGTGGSAMEMLTIRAVGPVPVSWVAPTQNVDGSALTDLAGYRIYYGTQSRAYSNMTDVAATQTSHTLSLASGDYYVAMTALDGEGNESTYSNEVLKSRP